MNKFKFYRIGEIFEKLEFKKCKKDKNVSKTESKDFNIPLVYAKKGDNGIMYYAKDGDYTKYSNVISIVYNGAVAAGLVYAHEEPTGILAESYFIRIKKEVNSNVSFNSNLYLKVAIEKSIYNKYSRDNLATWNKKVENDFIYLPITDDEKIDFDYMDSYIKKLKSNVISEIKESSNKKIEDYLKICNLENTFLNNDEKSLLSFEPNYKEFKLGGKDGLFDIKSPAKRFNANSVKVLDTKEKDSYNYIVRSSLNNGQRGYIIEDKKYLSPAKTLAFGQDTATVFYQSEPYFTGDKIKIMFLKEHELNEKIAGYFITVIRKAFSGFSWGQSSFNEKVLKSVSINLPVMSNGDIDYDYMEKYISVIQKIAIKDLEIKNNKFIDIISNMY